MVLPVMKMVSPTAMFVSGIPGAESVTVAVVPDSEIDATPYTLA
jgi:hypothetical protein